jgi:glyoxylase-like metal-dependent hydrolase (beta-lactamase superfamily II)
VTEKYKIPLLAHSKELFNLRGSVQYAQMTGLPFEPSPEPDEFLDNKKEVSFGNTVLEILFTPGHAPGHVCFFHRKSSHLFSGDVLFRDSIGRTDLPGGNYHTLMQSITKVVLPLGEEITVHSGHGSDTTTGEEARNNPFVLDFMRHGVKGI